MSWKKLIAENPDPAEFGQRRFASRVAYLATVRKDGAPRVHPVTPILGDGNLFVFMDRTSSKGYDLKRTDRFAMHASVENEEGGQKEFFIAGRAKLVEDEPLRSIAAKHAGYDVSDRYILFRLSPDEAFGTADEDNEVVRRRWKRSE
ncbi:MAG: pyridoxamine 5'-phosphate oxidase family protein [Candidatus Promineifilaceae bacterium]